MPDYDDRLREKDDGAYQRYKALRRVVREPGGRNKLRAIRRAARPPAPPPRRRPSLALFLLFGVVLAALVVVERAEGGHLC